MTKIVRDPKEATVAKVISEYRLIINRGSDDGVKQGLTYLVYEIGEEIIDPETQETLGNYEITKGRGIVINVQPKMATIETTATQTKHLSGMEALAQGSTTQVIKIGFNKPKIGDKAKYIH